MANGVIVYITMEDRKEWQDWSLQSWIDVAELLPDVYLYIHEGHKGDGYELGALDAAMDIYPGATEFLLVQDSILLKNPTPIIQAFTELKGFSVSFSYQNQSYFCKYIRKYVNATGIKIPKNKMDSINLEDNWNKMYVRLAEMVFWGEKLQDSMVFEEFLGRERMRIETPDFLKYKSVWHPGMVNQ